MSRPLNMYVTGATGFVGSHVVERALDGGHRVTAVVRPAGTAPRFDRASVSTGSIEEARVDLRSSRGLVQSLDGADLVIHLAAAKAGDFYTQFAGTVVATENLLTAMTEAGVANLVAISTFSVYDYLAMKPGTVLDERSPIDTSPELRDEYARTKLIQEDLYREFGQQDGNRVVILRPGMIYGPDNLWHALLGADVGPMFLRIGSKATLPLIYVENCADAMVLAAERLTGPDGSSLDNPAIGDAIINLVDDDLPTQEDYAELVASRIETPPTIAVPWPAIRTAAGLLKAGNRVILGGRAKFPGIAVPDRLHARFKPLRYSNRRAKELLGWSPRYDLRSAIDRSVAVQDGRLLPTEGSGR